MPELTYRNILFFEMLHEGRKIKGVLSVVPSQTMRTSGLCRKMYLLGIRRALTNHIDDIKAGQNIQDFWRHQQSGAEGI